MRNIAVIILYLTTSAVAFGQAVIDDVRGTPQMLYHDDTFMRCAVPILKFIDGIYSHHGTGSLIVYKERMYLLTNQHLMSWEKLYVASATTEQSRRIMDKPQEEVVLDDGTELVVGKERVIAAVRLIGTNKERLYYTHPTLPNLDIAVVPINFPNVVNDSIRLCEYVPIQEEVINKDDSLVRYGQICYMVGYPQGIGGVSPDTSQQQIDPITPLIRFGSVAWKHPYGNEIWLDLPSFGGNSGSPVLARIGVTKSDGTPIYVNKFIGINYGHPVSENQVIRVDTLKDANNIVLRHPKTKQAILIPRMDNRVVAENMMYARVIYSSRIYELLEYASAQLDKRMNDGRRKR